MKVLESALSLCDPMTISKLEDAPARNAVIEQAQECLIQNDLPKANRVYLGTESCEFLLSSCGGLLYRIIQEFAGMGYAVTYVLPPVGQEKFQDICTLIQDVAASNAANELVCNDIGTLSWVSEQNLPMKLRVGHHFDKMLREARFPVRHSPEIARNSSLFSVPYLEQTREKQLLQDMGVEGAEIDPVPGFSVKLPDNWQYAMWYPRTILSYCTTCEFAGLERPVAERYIPGKCSMECLYYQIVVHGGSMQKIIKSGRLVETISPLPLSQLCEGPGRLVWQCDSEGRKARNHEGYCADTRS